MSTLLNLWALHDWSTREDMEPLERPVDTNEPRWEASDMSVEDCTSAWERRFADLVGDE